jgi:predicted PhzF superfamily epimerase YddE/YHI9
MPSLVHVDAFADRPFAGNPAAVCVLDGPPEGSWMQTVAAELNLPATAFVWPHAGDFGLRWFTAVAELSLCGHGTLAAAHALFECGDAAGSATFRTAAAQLQARQSGELIELDFPLEASSGVDAPPALLRAIGQAPTSVERNRLDYLVELESEDAVRELQPDLAALREVDTRGLIVTARGSGSGQADFVSRYFAPRFGLDEDHVTGSAHCCLGPYWQRRLGRSALVGRQLSRRGGIVHVQMDGDRVRLGGQAVTVAQGQLSPATLGDRHPVGLHGGQAADQDHRENQPRGVS